MIQEAVRYLEARLAHKPSIGIVLGSAQAALAKALANPVEIEYKLIPGWPVPGVEGHAGKLIAGEIGGVLTAVMAGRVHLYEGWTPQEVTFGVRVLGCLGMKTLVLTNAAGGINPNYRRGMLVLLTDHINLQGSNPLQGANVDSLGPRFPDMSHAYDAELRAKALAMAKELGIELGEGVYAAMLGPSFETPAEIRFLRTIGADLAGMSTVPEAIVARHMGVRVLAISTVTNMAAGMQGELSHSEVLETGKASAQHLVRLLRHLVPQLEA
jgi:purine-nucleoside phosphorylase